MKTSVVLLALATAALAAPALHDEAFEDVHIPAKFLDAFTRERKSAIESSSSLSPETPVNLPSSQISEFGVSGRSFNLKKPIIIKKRVGSSYQVYRDSDEEKLDSPEPCRKQVRVKLCEEHSDAKSSDMMRSSTNEDASVHTTEDEMKHSIMLAKEAVENFQKDLRNIEHKPAKSAPWKHGDSESDAELHQDIEVARQALEHIHNNFGIMETPTTHDTTLKEAETVEDVTFPLASTEEERYAQWKDAIDNIQRNVELVRNIEESFKSAHDGIPHTENVPTKNIEKHELTTKEHMRVTENVVMEEEHKPAINELEHSKLEKSSELHETKTDLPQKDMMESASMVSTSKLQNLDHDDKARLTAESQMKVEHVAKEKDALEELHDDKHIVAPQNMEALALKLAEEVKGRKPESDHMEKTDKLEKVNLEESLLEKQRADMKELHDTTIHIKHKHDKQDKHMEKTEAKMTEKSAEHITDKDSELIKNKGKIHHEQHTVAQLKHADDITTEDVKLNTHSLSDMKPQETMVHKDQSFIQGKTAHDDNTMVSMGNTFQMRSPEDMKHMQHQMIDHPHMRWAQDKNFNTEMGLMKSAAETHQGMDHTKHMHSEHLHAHQQAHLDGSHGQHLRQHERFMAHGKSADMDNQMQSTYFMNMRDSDNMEQEGNRFKWRPTHAHHHETARTAYGAPAPASGPASGAIGLFPNANVGSCGIPLLLSCNPSVVSGSLAKAHPAPYSAPAYRTEDDFNFHSKRHVKKKENLVSTLNRTPANTILKTSSGLVQKH